MLPEPVVIAEIGCNHKGDIEVAREMILTARLFCKVAMVKFQKRTPRELLSAEEYRSPHPDPHHSYGRTYGEHREFLEFNLEQHRGLQELCRQTGIEYSVSVWDLTAAREMCSLAPAVLKVPSACNLNFELLGYLADSYGGHIHVSLGMTTRQEEEQIVEFLRGRGRLGEVVLYACTSGYPVPFEDVALLEIERLKASYGEEVEAIGFSGHHLGIALDPVAYALGARYLERHFTLDRTWKGTDHAASLEPDALRRVQRDLQATRKAMTCKREEILSIEQEQRRKLKRLAATAAGTGTRPGA